MSGPTSLAQASPRSIIGIYQDATVETDLYDMVAPVGVGQSEEVTQRRRNLIFSHFYCRSGDLKNGLAELLWHKSSRLKDADIEQANLHDPSPSRSRYPREPAVKGPQGFSFSGCEFVR